MRTTSETRKSLPPLDPPDNTQDEDERKRIVEIERLLDIHVGELLDRVAFKINEGNNGVIFKVPIFDIPSDLLTGLRANGLDLKTDRVFKVLKVYAPGIAHREFLLQQRAYRAVERKRRLLRAQGQGAPLAEIPEPFFARDIPLSEATAQKFRNAGVRVESKKGAGKNVESARAGVIMMDFAEGEDLATLAL